MNFLFVDRIHELIPGKKTVAVKHITPSDLYLTSFNGKTSLISCIIGEALGQLCSWNIIKSSDFKFRLIGGVVGEVKIHDDAYLGETLIMENTIERLDLDNQVVSFAGVARVGDRIILEVKNGLGPLLPVDDFGDVDTVKNEFNHIYREGPLPDIPKGKNIIETIDIKQHHVSFDRIIEWNKGVSVKAQKNISLIAPYLADHFPKRPVLPLSLLIESKLQLAYPFIAEMIGADDISTIKANSVRRIKMGEFVEPGDVLFTTMKLKEHKDNTFILTFRSEANGKRICVCEAEFTVRSA